MLLEIINAIGVAVNACLFVYLVCELRRAGRVISEAEQTTRWAKWEVDALRSLVHFAIAHMQEEGGQ